MKKTLILSLALCAALSLSPAVLAEQTAEEITAPAEAAEETGVKATLSRTTMTLARNKTKQLTVNYSEEGVTGRVTWKTSDKKVATVNKGAVSARGVGTATITAEVQIGDEVQTLTCEVTVLLPVSSITLSQRKMELSVGDVVDLPTAQLKPSNASVTELVWTSSNEKVAVITEDGRLSIVGDGTAKITATSAQPFSNPPKASFTVTAVRNVSEIQMVEELLLAVGDDAQLKATVLPEDATDRSLNWGTSDDSVATVDRAGKVHGIGAGTAVITCRAADGSGVKAQCTVTVRVMAESVTSTLEDSIVLSAGISRKLTVTVMPLKADPTVEWKSADPTVVSVAEDGTMTALSAGITHVTATTVDGSNLSHVFSVVVEPANPIVILGISREKKSTDEAECLYIQPKNVSSTRTVKSFRFYVSLEDIGGNVSERYVCEWSREGNTIKPGK